MPGDDPGGWIVTAIIGVASALIGGFLAGLCLMQTRWTSSLTSRAGLRQSSGRSSCSSSTVSSWIAAAAGTAYLTTSHGQAPENPGPGADQGSPDVAVTPRRD